MAGPLRCRQPVRQQPLTVQGAMPRDAEFKQNLCADIDGFSLHAAVRCGADDRKALEQLCRYITRPVLANERVQTNAAGQVVLKLKTPWRRHHAPGDVAAGVHAAACGPGAATMTAPANDCFAAVNLGGRIPGLGRGRLLPL